MASRLLRTATRSVQVAATRVAFPSSVCPVAPARSLHVWSLRRSAEPAPAAAASAVPLSTPAPSVSPSSGTSVPTASSEAAAVTGSFRDGGQRGGGPERPDSPWSTRLGILFFLSTAAYTLYLGQWQIKRRAWKQESATSQAKEGVKKVGLYRADFGSCVCSPQSD